MLGPVLMLLDAIAFILARLARVRGCVVDELEDLRRLFGELDQRDEASE